MRKIRVLQVNKLYHPQIGGVEKVVQDIAEGLKDKVDMKVLVCQPKGRGGEDVINGVNVFRAGSIGTYLSMPLSFSFPFILKKMSKDNDILHFHIPFPLGDISYSLIGFKGKVVAWWHSDIVRQKHLLTIYRPLLFNFLQRIDKIMVATPYHIESSPVLKHFKDKCEIIPFGLDLNRFQKNEKVQEKVNHIRSKYGSKIVLFIGRLIYYKGVEYLIQAMKEVDARLLLIGDGPLVGSLKELVIKLGLLEKVIFLGKVGDAEMPVYYHACDIFVLPSIAKTEAFGLVQLEAMACAKPVINTFLPTGVPYVSLNGKTGLTVQPGEVGEMARAINSLFKDNVVREKYGQNALLRVQKHFTLSTMIEKVYKVYEDVLQA